MSTCVGRRLEEAQTIDEAARSLRNFTPSSTELASPESTWLGVVEVDQRVHGQLNVLKVQIDGDSIELLESSLAPLTVAV